MTSSQSRSFRLLCATAAAAFAAASICALPVRAADEPPAAVDVPKIDVSKSPAIQKYQLKRLTKDQLVLVERKPEKPYSIIYQAVLTRKGVDKKFRADAAESLGKINGTSAAVELINALGLVDEDDKTTPKELVSLLMQQKAAALSAVKEKLQSLAADAEKPVVKQAAYAAWVVADSSADAAWKAADERGDLKTLIAGVPLIADGKLRASLFDKLSPLVGKAKDDDMQLAAIDAVSFLAGHEVDEFKMLAELIGGPAGAKRDAAIKSLDRIPAAKFAKDQVAAAAAKVVAAIEAIPVEQRTEEAGVNAVQLAKDLSTALPADDGNVLRKKLRGLAPQIVKMRTYREQMLYDTRYFVVEAGKPVQIVLENDDAMQHNVVVTTPGKLSEVANAGASLANPPEGQKPYVPQSKNVLAASELANGDETIKLSFTTPKKPGAYEYVCTFPGHFVRMYGVMLVVDDIDQYDRNPKPPLDPLTKKPIESPRNEPMDAPAAEHAMHQH